MKILISIVSITIIGFFASIAQPILAHQPRMIESESIGVIDPEVSKAFYGKLTSTPHVYTIVSSKPYELYIGILMPYSEDSKNDIQAEIRQGEQVLGIIGGEKANWEKMFEFFGQSTYWDGGDYKENVGSGTYTIIVSSSDNMSKYSLAVGTLELFDVRETVNALHLIPQLKRDFFEESPISFIKSPFGWGYVLIMYILAFLFGFLYRYIQRQFSQNIVRKSIKNIGTMDRIVRLAIGLGLLILAITTSWSPLLLFFSGFAIFEAFFSWCGFYALIGKNSCPI